MVCRGDMGLWLVISRADCRRLGQLRESCCQNKATLPGLFNIFVITNSVFKI